MVQLHQLHQRMFYHRLQVAVVSQLNLQAKGQALQDWCCSVVGVPLKSVDRVVKLVLMLLACAQQDHSTPLLYLLLHLQNQARDMTVIMDSLPLLCCPMQQCQLVMILSSHGCGAG